MYSNYQSKLSSIAANTMLGTVVGYDEVNTSYTFGVYPINATPAGKNAVSIVT